MTEESRWEWLGQVIDRIGLEDALLFGGAAFDWSSGTRTIPDDVDLQAGGGETVERRFLDSVDRDKGAVLLSGPRDYWIFHHEHVRLFEVRVDGVMLDINLMDTRVRPGHFSIETVRWGIAERQLEDPHSALAEGHRPHLVTAVDSDNPIRMLARMIRLARKYSIPLLEPPLFDVALDLRDRAMRWESRQEFHSRDAWESYARLIARILRDSPEGDALRAELGALDLIGLRERAGRLGQGEERRHV